MKNKMKREIKFRVWRESMGAMDYSPSGVADYSHNCDINQELNSEYCVYLQFTGLLDRNGKEIYESDVITGGDLGSEKREVKWLGAGFNLPLEVEMSEVIGNIYENPDLLIPNETK